MCGMSSYVLLSSQHRPSPSRHQCQHLTSCSLLNPLPDAEVEHFQLGNEVLSPLLPPIAWKVPRSGNVDVSIVKGKLHKASTEPSKGEEFLLEEQANKRLTAAYGRKYTSFKSSNPYRISDQLTIVEIIEMAAIAISIISMS